VCKANVSSACVASMGNGERASVGSRSRVKVGNVRGASTSSKVRVNVGNIGGANVSSKDRVNGSDGGVANVGSGYGAGTSCRFEVGKQVASSHSTSSSSIAWTEVVVAQDWTT
jgi:hypothetical protein